MEHWYSFNLFTVLCKNVKWLAEHDGFHIAQIGTIGFVDIRGNQKFHLV